MDVQYAAHAAHAVDPSVLDACPSTRNGALKLARQPTVLAAVIV